MAVIAATGNGQDSTVAAIQGHHGPLLNTKSAACCQPLPQQLFNVALQAGVEVGVDEEISLRGHTAAHGLFEIATHLIGVKGSPFALLIGLAGIGGKLDGAAPGLAGLVVADATGVGHLGQHAVARFQGGAWIETGVIAVW